MANAALQAFSPFIESTQQHWDDIVDTNIKGTVNTLKIFLPLMIPNKKGKVVIISSTQGRCSPGSGFFDIPCCR